MKDLDLDGHEYTNSICKPTRPNMCPSVYLNEKQVAALFGDSIPGVGVRYTLVADVEVVSVSNHENEEGRDRCVSLRLNAAKVEGVARDAKTALYGE